MRTNLTRTIKNHPSVSAFPDSTFGSACTSAFSRIARRLLALRPAHSRGHQFRDCYPRASDILSPPCLPRLLPAGAVAGWGLHPLESAALSRRTPFSILVPAGLLVSYGSLSDEWTHRVILGTLGSGSDCPIGCGQGRELMNDI